jgi:hypothetical protein
MKMFNRCGIAASYLKVALQLQVHGVPGDPEPLAKDLAESCDRY